MSSQDLSLSDKVLVAALQLTSGETRTEFTAEDLVVAVWKSDNSAFGLRGHEAAYPDNNKVYTKLDGKSGLVTKGLLVKSGERTLRLTTAGLARAVSLEGGTNTDHTAKLDRATQDAVRQILNHPEFNAWLKDPASPSRVSGAGHFWGIAPGTPADAVRSRVIGVERTLDAALKSLDDRGITEIVEQRGRVMFDRTDLKRALDFQRALRDRFRSELKRLDPGYSY
jgi:hypothetical protein